MGRHPVGLGLDERRPLPRTGPVTGLFGLLVDGEHVVAVHLAAGEAVAIGPFGYGAGDLELYGDGDGVDVVLNEKHDGQVVDACEVHSLVPVAAARRSLAAADEHDAVLAAHLERERGASGLRVLYPDGGRGRNNVQFPTAVVARHLASGAVRVFLFAV